MIPILEGLEAIVPRDWINDCTNIFGPLVYELQVSAFVAEGMGRDDIELLIPVTEEASGRRGRPKKNIDSQYLKEATTSNQNIKVGTLAKALGVHRHTLRKKMRELGIEKRFDDLDDDELDDITRQYKERKPTSGLRYLRDHYRCHGIRALRTHLVIKRRRYKVPRPNYLWHCDGHHTLFHELKGLDIKLSLGQTDTTYTIGGRGSVRVYTARPRRLAFFSLALHAASAPPTPTSATASAPLPAQTSPLLTLTPELLTRIALHLATHPPTSDPPPLLLMLGMARAVWQTSSKQDDTIGMAKTGMV
ncbi:hypothetical protein B0H11DRAFT_2250518 [Mycena galericulata]|nr:hypothetical protein B0H11DRAFT_2250518 [Mycena galericulata]